MRAFNLRVFVLKFSLLLFANWASITLGAQGSVSLSDTDISRFKNSVVVSGVSQEGVVYFNGGYCWEKICRAQNPKGNFGGWVYLYQLITYDSSDYVLEKPLTFKKALRPEEKIQYLNLVQGVVDTSQLQTLNAISNPAFIDERLFVTDLSSPGGIRFKYSATPFDTLIIAFLDNDISTLNCTKCFIEQSDSKMDSGIHVKSINIDHSIISQISLAQCDVLSALSISNSSVIQFSTESARIKGNTTLTNISSRDSGIIFEGDTFDATFRYEGDINDAGVFK